MANVLLEVTGLQKSFGGVAALSNGQFCLEANSVHALCGGNGAGKSTFLSIVMGIQARDKGRILINGNKVEFTNPSEALAAGVSIIEQELSPVPAMSVAENMFLGREPIARFGRVDFKKMNANAQENLDKLGFSIKATDLMMDLTVAKMQLVEIAKALSYNSQIIIMDEPTSALGESEAERLFSAISTLKKQGKGIVYVSHRLSEIFQISDAYTVFRNGQYVDSGYIKDSSRDDLIQKIVGSALSKEKISNHVTTENKMLSVKGLMADSGVKNIDFTVHKGEILGLYGLMGSGRTEIFERLFGLSNNKGGDIFIQGNKVNISSPKAAIELGMALVTEDRKGSGLNMSADIRSNICLANLQQYGFGGALNNIISTKKESQSSKKMIDLFSIRTTNDKLGVSSLSGGNQQKVVLGKWFLTSPTILLLDEPTRGVDVGAKREIYTTMSKFAAQGGTIIMVSSEIDEVIDIADRVIVMREGEISGEVDKQNLTPELLVNLAT